MNLLFTCAGRRGYLLDYFRRALGGVGQIHALNSHLHAPAFAYADHAGRAPPVADPDYVDFLLDYCRQHAIDAVLPLIDPELPVLARSRERFARCGTRIVVSDEAVTMLAFDKLESANFLARHGIATPMTCASVETAMDAVRVGSLRFPLVVKPRLGMASHGVWKVDDEAELRMFHRRASLVDGCVRAHAAIVQQWIDGEEYGLDVVNDLRGNHVATLARHKIAMRAGETDVARTVNDPALVELGRVLGQGLRHVAMLDVDVIAGSDGPVVIEFNPRFGGGYPFSHLAGADVPRAIVAWLRGEPVDGAWLHCRAGVTGAKDVVPMRLDDRHRWE